MGNIRLSLRLMSILLCVLGLTSCGVGIVQHIPPPPPPAIAVGQLPTGQPTGIGGPLPPETVEADAPSILTATPPPAVIGGEPDTELRQWASSAYTTSELDAEHSADQVTGDPITEGCSFDGYSYTFQPNAWASAGVDSIETLAVNYDVPVIPTAVIIHLVMLPDAVTQVDVVDTTGAYHTVYSGDPFDLDFCPYLMQVDVQDVNVPVDQVIITLDQTVFGNPTEIDAVELVGLP